jgi:esterase/lipase superfamily enzyme
MSNNAHRLAVALMLALVLRQVPAAQNDAGAIVTVPANSEARSAAFPLTATGELTVRLQGAAPTNGTVRVYVFDQAGVLRGLDDPEVTEPVFTWYPATTDRYYVKVANTSGSPVTLRIESNPSKEVRERPLKEYASVRVQFATNRRAETTEGTVKFGVEPSQMSYGYADVSIPRDHRMGELEAPTIWRLELRGDPAKHVLVLEAKRIDEAAFFKQVADRVSMSAKKEAFVFVHGFNVAFDDAVRRTAQMAYDLAFEGPAITFSWPSQGSLAPLDYTKDQRNADLSAQALQDFLARLKGTSSQLTVHLVAHSMGNRVIARALERLGADVRPSGKPLLQEVAMMAPDIDAELFRQAAGKIAASAQHVTLYASSADLALKAAQKVAGYPRAGEGGSGIVVVPGVDTIDASSVETSWLGLSHAYYADNSTILSDLFGLIRGRRPSDRFGLQAVKISSGTYWQFKPAAR